MIGQTSIVLVVDDNSLHQELIAEALREGGTGISVGFASDGADALEKLGLAAGAQAPRLIPSLIILDMRMPEMSGCEVAREIKKSGHFEGTPVVIFTSSADERDIKEGYHSGANSYVVKPVNFGEFIDAVKEMARYWLKINTGLEEAVT